MNTAVETLVTRLGMRQKQFLRLLTIILDARFRVGDNRNDEKIFGTDEKVKFCAE